MIEEIGTKVIAVDEKILIDVLYKHIHDYDDFVSALEELGVKE